ncbi:glycosyltransferase, partial [bacterium]|nr:glycosyltransferase [bacterium]
MIEVGLSELSEIVKFADLVLCDSEYNRKQVAEIGCHKAEVLPVYINIDRLRNNFSKVIETILCDGHVNLLHVGRIAPNKRIEDIIKIFYYYKKKINKQSRLFLVGQYSDMGVEGYHERLLELVDKLSLEDVFFTGKIGQDELNSYYKFSNLYLSMSEHEGFCVPLIESMFFDLPILALNSTAVPYTLDGAGILIEKKDYSQIIGMIDLLVNDEQFREAIINSQRKRLRRYMDFDFEKTLKKHIIELFNDSN